MKRSGQCPARTQHEVGICCYYSEFPPCLGASVEFDVGSYPLIGCYQFTLASFLHLSPGSDNDGDDSTEIY